MLLRSQDGKSTAATRIPIAMMLISIGMMFIVFGIVWPRLVSPVAHTGTDWHDFLRGLCGMVVLSGYASPLYDGRLSDWRRVEKKTYADGARPRTEVLWLNPACAAALDAVGGGAGMPLFGEVQG